MTLCALFEDFGTETPPRRQTEEDESVEVTLAKVRGRARADGFADGVASVRSELDVERATLLRAISEGIADAQFTRAGADSQTIDVISNSVVAIIDLIAPDIGHLRLVEEIADAVRQLLDEQTGQPLTVFVAPDRFEEMAEVLSSTTISAEVRADPALGALQARVDWKTGFELVDISSLISRATEVLKQHLGTAEADRPAITEWRYVHE